MRAFLVLLLLPLSLPAQEWRFRTLAGSARGGGYADGAGEEARFSGPNGVVACGGAIFVSDTGNDAIRRIDGNAVTTFARGLRVPAGITATADCTLYVADRGSNSVRRVSPAGEVTTVASGFNLPNDVAVDADGSIWVSNTGDNTIRRISPAGAVSIVAGVPGAPSRQDGVGDTARFSEPTGIALDTRGRLVVVDYRAQSIRLVTRAGEVSTILTGSAGGFPVDVAVAPDGTIYAIDINNAVVQRVNANNTLTALHTTRLDSPRGIAVDADGSLVVAERGASAITRVGTDGAVARIAGSVAERGYVDATGADARFLGSFGIDVDARGIVWAAAGRTIRQIDPQGRVTTFAGSPDESAHRDGRGGEARFTGASKIAIDPTDGSAVVTDGATIRRVSPDGDVTTIAGTQNQYGFRDAAGAEARFSNQMYVAVGNDGTIYVSDGSNKAIRRISGDVVTTLHRDNAFSVTMGLDVDNAGNVYFWEENLAAAYKVTPDGQRTTVFQDPALATLAQSLALGPDGAIYLGGFRIHSILRIAGGTLERFAGRDESPGNQNGTLAETRFRTPLGLAFGPDGRLYVSDVNAALRVGERPPPAPPSPRRRALR